MQECAYVYARLGSRHMMYACAQFCKDAQLQRPLYICVSVISSVYADMCQNTCVCACGGHRLTLDIFLKHSAVYSFEPGACHFG